MRIVHREGVEGARGAAGTVVVIDVLRAFTVSAYALAGGAVECRLVAEVEEARALAGCIEGAVISAEVEGLPVEGIAISNSPTMVRDAGLRGRTLIQRTSSGTQGVVAAAAAERLLACSLTVASATARAILAAEPELVTVVATGGDRGHLEDAACAGYLAAVLQGERPDLEALLAPFYRTERYGELSRGRWPGFPATDVDLALAADRFDFAMPVERDGLGLRLRALPT
ncbi:MAG TPA: 2-phosphosulfolactate phosphatase [Terriglobales bacterium]|nr:2-phosphosulfolactate phosphatase [Terriglobales bacterium]